MKAPLTHPTLSRPFVHAGAAPRYVANFDSSSAMLRALASHLKGKPFPQLRLLPPSESLATFVNSLPRKVRETIYIYGGRNEAIRPRHLKNVRAEMISEWVAAQYPRTQVPGVMIGSSSGAIPHLGAALGIPWLPQTFFIPVVHPKIDVDDPRTAAEWALEPAKELLETNPELQLHHMWDPSQDRLMLARMTYFRVKRLILGKTYERFLKERLEPGGTIFLMECHRPYPSTKMGPRHYFQMGALGGATEHEFYRGGPRVAEYLERYDAPVRQWDPPPADGASPEAEWGFEPALRDDVLRFARNNGYRVRRVIFDEPEHLSRPVADLYRWWYAQRRMRASRLIIDSFILMDPHWTLRTGSVPYWMKFNMEPSAESVERYLAETRPFDEIHLMLFAHGVDAIGLPPIERWRSILQKARKRGAFLGVDERRYPRDFGSFIRYSKDLPKQIPARYPMPAALTLDRFDDFLKERGKRDGVSWDGP